MKIQMIGFQRVVTPVQPGGSTTLTFSFNETDLSIVDTETVCATHFACRHVFNLPSGYLFCNDCQEVFVCQMM